MLLLVVLHLGALHEVGSNNPDGVDIKKVKDNADRPSPLDGIPFHPYYTVKDMFGVGFFLIIAAFILFFAPTFGGWFLEHDNFIAGQSAGDAGAHQAGLVLHARTTRCCARCRTSCSGVMVMGGAIDDPVPAAVAGPQPGQVDPLSRHAVQGDDRACSWSPSCALG